MHDQYLPTIYTVHTPTRVLSTSLHLSFQQTEPLQSMSQLPTCMQIRSEQSRAEQSMFIVDALAISCTNRVIISARYSDTNNATASYQATTFSSEITLLMYRYVNIYKLGSVYIYMHVFIHIHIPVYPHVIAALSPHAPSSL
jgi:hypothetical protein